MQGCGFESYTCHDKNAFGEGGNGNHLIKSTSLEKPQSPVSGFHGSLVDSSKFNLLNKFACINMVFIIILLLLCSKSSMQHRENWMRRKIKEVVQFSGRDE